MARWLDGLTCPVSPEAYNPAMLVIALSFVVGAALGASVAAALLLTRMARLATEAARLGAELGAATRAAEEQRVRATEAQARLADQFSALSRDALQENRGDFLQSVEQLFTPVRDTLDRVQKELADVDKAREGSFRSVATQLQQLSVSQQELRSATETLTRSLRSPNVRGQWGEIQLRRIVELAGMLEQCDFVEKATTETADGARQTPDLIVKLPGGSNIIVDAKVPIDAYIASTNAKTEVERQDRLAAHARQVRDHVRALASKEYWRQFDPAPEFVVMFLPLEPLLAAAFEHDGTLLEQSASLRVILATPMTTLALLKAVAYGWQQQAVQRNTEEIQQIGRELYDRLALLADHLTELGRGLTKAAESYDKFVGSLQQRVLPGARRFKDLGVSSTRELTAPEPINLTLRVATPEALGLASEPEPAPPMTVVRRSV